MRRRETVAALTGVLCTLLALTGCDRFNPLIQTDYSKGSLFGRDTYFTNVVAGYVSTADGRIGMMAVSQVDDTDKVSVAVSFYRLQGSERGITLRTIRWRGVYPEQMPHDLTFGPDGVASFTLTHLNYLGAVDFWKLQLEFALDGRVYSREIQLRSRQFNSYLGAVFVSSRPVLTIQQFLALPPSPPVKAPIFADTERP